MTKQEKIQGKEVKEAVKGLQGNWHFTNGEFDKSGNKLKTLCGKSISPNFRRFNIKDAKRMVNCPNCMDYEVKECLSKER